jgi:hypothetical protein
MRLGDDLEQDDLSVSVGEERQTTTKFMYASPIYPSATRSESSASPISTASYA